MTMNPREIQIHLANLKQAPGRMSFLTRVYREKVREIHAEAPYIQPAEYRRRLRQARDEQEQQMASLRAQCLNAQERIQVAADRARGESGRHSDPARAILEQRAWARILPLLARQPSLPEMVARAKELIAAAGRQGDLATLRAIRTELPAYLEAHEPADSRARRVAAGKSFEAADGSLGALLDDVAKAGAPHLPPEERLAAELEEAIKPFDQAILGNLAWMEQALDDPEKWSSVAMIGWQPGTYIPAGTSIEVPSQPPSDTNDD